MHTLLRRSTPRRSAEEPGTSGPKRRRLAVSPSVPSSRRALIWAVAVVQVGSLAAGCRPTTPAAGTSSDDPVTVTPQVSVVKTSPPDPAVATTWPLTGVAGAVEERPALSVKIENSVEARPQSGLREADLVWEEVVEGGISRFVAVYHSQPPQAVGPVRSVRPMDGAIAGPTRGLLAFSGGQDRFVTRATEAGLQVLSHDAGASGFYREPSRRAPHDTYARPADLIAQADAEHSAAPVAQFAQADRLEDSDPVRAGRAVERLDLVLSTVARPAWEYSAPDGFWLRSEGRTPAQDADGERLSAVNVVVLRVQVVAAGGTDSAGSPIPETVMVASGSGLVATGGHVLDVTWSKASPQDPVHLADASGDPVHLAPGNTWIELVPAADGQALAS